jgi:hypothetical protein
LSRNAKIRTHECGAAPTEIPWVEVVDEETEPETFAVNRPANVEKASESEKLNVLLLVDVVE